MRKLSIETEKVNMEYERYRFLFGFDNLVTVFSPYDYMNVTHSSKDYKVTYSFEHTCSSIEDVLMDLEVFVRTGNGKVVLNDVVGIKINGSVYCFRYLGMKNAQLSLLDGYHEVTNFIETEKNNLIREIHRENKVMSVLHGELIPIDKIEIEENLLYAIDGEMFKPTGDYGKGFTTTDYSLYCLEEDMEINKVNPYPKPFFNISVALYYFLHSKNGKRTKKRCPILLLNRQELEMIKDYHQLNRLIG